MCQVYAVLNFKCTKVESSENCAQTQRPTLNPFNLAQQELSNPKIAYSVQQVAQCSRQGYKKNTPMC